jgi:hypothetical protein
LSGKWRRGTSWLTPASRASSRSDRPVMQSPQAGALPTLYAATGDLLGGASVGPGGRGEQRGAPALVERSGTARDKDLARRLWSVSEEMTGTRCAPKR